MYVFIVPFLIRNRRQATKEFLNSEVKEFLSPLSSLALVKMGCYFLLKIQFEIKKPIDSKMDQSETSFFILGFLRF